MGNGESRGCGDIWTPQAIERTEEDEALEQAQLHQEKILELMVGKLNDECNQYRGVDPHHHPNVVIEVLKVFSTSLKEYETNYGEIQASHCHLAFAKLKEEKAELDLGRIQTDLHETKLLGDDKIGAMVYEIEALCHHLPQELLRDHCTFWMPKGKSLATDDSAGDTLDASQLKSELKTHVFNHFDTDRMGELDVDQTVACLEAFNKMPAGRKGWTSVYLMKFLDKHFFTSNGVMSKHAFDRLFTAVGDGVIWGLFALHEIGVDPMLLLNLFTRFLSGRAIAYMVKAFVALDSDQDAIIGADAIEVIAMAANPSDGRMARRTKRVLSEGDSKVTWRMRLDVNGDMKITLAEWVLFWGRNCEANPPKLRSLLATYRIHDYVRLLQYKRKGQLRDRYMLLFDAMDTDGESFHSKGLKKAQFFLSLFI